MSGGSFFVLRISQCQARQPRCRFAGATTLLCNQSDGGWEAPFRQFFRSIGAGTGERGTSARVTDKPEVMPPSLHIALDNAPEIETHGARRRHKLSGCRSSLLEKLHAAKDVCCAKYTCHTPFFQT
jgi:hypothetical protein